MTGCNKSNLIIHINISHDLMLLVGKCHEIIEQGGERGFSCGFRFSFARSHNSVNTSSENRVWNWTFLIHEKKMLCFLHFLTGKTHTYHGTNVCVFRARFCLNKLDRSIGCFYKHSKLCLCSSKRSMIAAQCDLLNNHFQLHIWPQFKYSSSVCVDEVARGPFIKSNQKHIVHIIHYFGSIYNFAHSALLTRFIVWSDLLPALSSPKKGDFFNKYIGDSIIETWDHVWECDLFWMMTVDVNSSSF